MSQVSQAGLEQSMIEKLEENNNKENLKDKEVAISIKEGEDMVLPCLLSEYFNEEVSWESESNTPIPEGAIQQDGLLIFKKINQSFTNVSCHLMSQTETKQVYHIYVIGKNETRLSPYGTMPRDLEAFNCEGDQLQKNLLSRKI